MHVPADRPLSGIVECLDGRSAARLPLLSRAWRESVADAQPPLDLGRYCRLPVQRLPSGLPGFRIVSLALGVVEDFGPVLARCPHIRSLSAVAGKSFTKATMQQLEEFRQLED